MSKKFKKRQIIKKVYDEKHKKKIQLYSKFKDIDSKKNKITNCKQNILSDNKFLKTPILKIESEITIGVITSGGDAPGMNSAIKGIINMSHKLNINIYGIYNGFKGLIENEIKKLELNDFNFDSLEGGTILRTMRSNEFESRNARKMGVENLIKHGINYLIVIGGGGSMIGSFTLWKEFDELKDELIIEKKIKSIKTKLKLVTIPGSIDNDIYGTESTLGADSAANRVIETIDNIACTMRSHGRILVVECMGNGCGWLTMVSAMAVNGDYVILPEQCNIGWEEELKKTVNVSLAMKKDSIVIFLSEKSRDKKGKIISLKMIQDVLIRYEVRVLCLGHIQRSGTTSGIDAVLGVLSGIKSVALCMTESYEPKMICFSQEGIKLINLEEIVDGIIKNEILKKQKDYNSLFKRRSEDYKVMYHEFEKHRKSKINYYEKKIKSKEIKNIEIIKENKNKEKNSNLKKIVILNKTKNISGINSFLNSIIQEGIYNEYKIYNFIHKFSEFEKIEQNYLCQFSMFRNNDNSILGQIEELNIERIKNEMKKTNIDYLIIIGGNESLNIAIEIKNSIIIPTCYKNVLDWTRTIGSDTMLNKLIKILNGYKRNVIVSGSVNIIEIGEEESQYINIMAGIACNVFAVLDRELGIFSLYESTAERIQNSMLKNVVNLSSVINNHKKTKNEILEILKQKILIYLKKNKNAKIIILKHGNFFKRKIVKKVFFPEIEPVFISNILENISDISKPYFEDRIFANLAGITLIRAINQNVGSGIITYKNRITEFEHLSKIIKLEKNFKEKKWWKILNLFD